MSEEGGGNISSVALFERRRTLIFRNEFAYVCACMCACVCVPGGCENNRKQDAARYRSEISAKQIAKQHKVSTGCFGIFLYL